MYPTNTPAGPSSDFLPELSSASLASVRFHAGASSCDGFVVASAAELVRQPRGHSCHSYFASVAATIASAPKANPSAVGGGGPFAIMVGSFSQKPSQRTERDVAERGVSF